MRGGGLVVSTEGVGGQLHLGRRSQWAATGVIKGVTTPRLTDRPSDQ